MSVLKNKKPRRKWLPSKNEIKTSISNACPHCFDRAHKHLQTTVITKQGEITVKICTNCHRQYQKIGQNEKGGQEDAGTWVTSNQITGRGMLD